MKRLRIATRRSALAMWQAHHVADRLRAVHDGIDVELVPMVTRGDRIIDRPLSAIGGKGLFLKELEVAMLEGRADLAVHSMKDVPAELEPGLALAAILPRATPWDAWICPAGTALEALPRGARVGTSSLRRRSQLLAARPDLEVADLRGNVDTRLDRVANGDFAAIILACAGLERLGWGDRVTEPLRAPGWLPAPAQGAIGIETRADDAGVHELLAPLDDADTALAVKTERRVAAALGGSCHVPLAAYASITGETLALEALVAEPDGSRVLRGQAVGGRDDGAAVAAAVVDRLAEQGARDIIAALEPDNA